MCYLRLLISTHNPWLHIWSFFQQQPYPHPQASRPLRSPSSGKLLQWPRCVSKQSGCEMAEICRQPSLPPFPPSPFCLQCMFHFPPLGGGMRLVFFFFMVTGFSSIYKNKELSDSSSLHPHVCSLDSLRSYTTEDSPQTRCSLRNTLSHCAHRPVLGLTLLLFDKGARSSSAQGLRSTCSENDLGNLSRWLI